MGKALINKEKKRNDLLSSAYELFTTIGFPQTTILNIAHKASVGKGTFYLYFQSKEDIRDALIMQKSSDLLKTAIDKLDKYTREQEKAGEIVSVSDKIIFVIDYILTYLSKNIALLKFISKNLSGGIMSAQVNSKNHNGEPVGLKKFVMDICEDDWNKIEDPDLLLYTIIEMVNSTCYNAILYGEPVTFSEYKVYLYKTIRLMVNNAIVDKY